MFRRDERKRTRDFSSSERCVQRRRIDINENSVRTTDLIFRRNAGLGVEDSNVEVGLFFSLRRRGRWRGMRDEADSSRANRKLLELVREGTSQLDHRLPSTRDEGS